MGATDLAPPWLSTFAICGSSSETTPVSYTSLPSGRGVTEPAASLTAEAGIAVFKIAFGRWIDAANRHDFRDLIRESLDELKSVAAGG
jgi:hypothetical protein